MSATLTIHLDADVLQLAEQAARSRHTTLPEVVAHQLRLMARNWQDSRAGKTPVTDALRGAVELCEMTLVELWNGAQGDAEKRVLRELQAVLPLISINAAVWLKAMNVAQKCRAGGVPRLRPMWSSPRARFITESRLNIATGISPPSRRHGRVWNSAPHPQRGDGARRRRGPFSSREKHSSSWRSPQGVGARRPVSARRKRRKFSSHGLAVELEFPREEQ